jgi:hypothetical protein
LLCGYKSTVKLLFIPPNRGVGIDASAHTTVVDVVEDVVDVVDEVVDDVVDDVEEVGEVVDVVGKQEVVVGESS